MIGSIANPLNSEPCTRGREGTNRRNHVAPRSVPYRHELRYYHPSPCFAKRANTSKRAMRFDSDADGLVQSVSVSIFNRQVKMSATGGALVPDMTWHDMRNWYHHNVRSHLRLQCNAMPCGVARKRRCCMVRYGTVPVTNCPLVL